MSDTAPVVKKTVRARRTAVSSEQASIVKPVPSLAKTIKAHEETFTDILRSINDSKDKFVALQKEIDEAQESFVKEKNDHAIAIAERNQQEEVARKREKETYDYEITLLRKKAEDEFLEKKAKWERELENRKEELAEEKSELENLRKLAQNFDLEKEKAVKEACALLEKELNANYAAEKRMREQEIKSEKELSTLKINNLTQENVRQTNEIVSLKKSLEEATSQLKEVAVKVIESSSPQVKPQTPSAL